MEDLTRGFIQDNEVNQNIKGIVGAELGWYRIAKRSINHLSHTGIIRIVTDNKVLRFEAELRYGTYFSTGTITPIVTTTTTIGDIRIAHSNIKDSQAFIEIYCLPNIELDITLINSVGWELMEPIATSNALTLGYTSERVHINELVMGKSDCEVSKTALALNTARAITLTGTVNGTAKFDGSADITINTTGDIQSNPYIHPDKHPASMITEEANKRFMTDAERTKLNAIADNANNYTHPANHPASIIIQDENNRLVTDVEKLGWDQKATVQNIADKISEIVSTTPETLNTLAKIATAINNNPNFATEIMTMINGKVDVQEGKVLSSNDFTTVEKTKLGNIAESANNYTHPETHLASTIVFQDGETLQQKFDAGTLVVPQPQP